MSWSTDPSPWSDGTPSPDDVEFMTTPQLLLQGARDRAEREREEARNHELWQRLAHRVTASGQLIR